MESVAQVGFRLKRASSEPRFYLQAIPTPFDRLGVRWLPTKWEHEGVVPLV